MMRSVVGWLGFFSYLLGALYIYVQFTAFDLNRFVYLLPGSYGCSFVGFFSIVFIPHITVMNGLKEQIDKGKVKTK